MQARTIGLDLAKNTFQVHAVDNDGLVVARRALRRSEVLPFLRKLARPCLVGVEACATAHYWAREIGTIGNSVYGLSG